MADKEEDDEESQFPDDVYRTSPGSNSFPSSYSQFNNNSPVRQQQGSPSRATNNISNIGSPNAQFYNATLPAFNDV